MEMEQQLLAHIGQAFKALFEAEAPDNLSLQPTRKDFEGTYTLVTFPLARLSKKNPQETAQLIGQHLQENSPLVSGFNVVKGFLNLVIAQKAWLQVLQGMLQTPAYGQLPAKNQTVMVEYSSPNTNKPLHLGHLRNNFLGHSVSLILEAAGYKVVKSNLVNDRGIHICKSMVAYQHFGNGETPESSGIKGDHLVGKYYVAFDKAYRQQIAELVQGGMEKETAEKEAAIYKEAQDMLLRWEKNEPETVALWEKLNGWVYQGFEATYKRMGVAFDHMYKESQTYLLGKDIVDEGLEKEVFYKRDNGSVWANLTNDGYDEKLVLRADGTSVYITQDLGTADLKFKDYGASKSVYVVGNEQDYHFAVLFKMLEKLGRPYAPGLYHLSYGMVDLPTGKMKSREGTVVDADDLMQEMVDTAESTTKALGKIEGLTEQEAAELYDTLALGALKYYLLKVDPKKRMLFNPEESIEFHGNTGPFIQYTHARIAAILRKANQLGLSSQEAALPAEVPALHDTESQLIYLASQYPARVEEAAAQYEPSIIAQYVYDLAKEYNRFYTELSVFNEEDAALKALRIKLSGLVGHVIAQALGLLGVRAPQRM